jgi:hypothetical protein
MLHVALSKQSPLTHHKELNIATCPPAARLLRSQIVYVLRHYPVGRLVVFAYIIGLHLFIYILLHRWAGSRAVWQGRQAGRQLLLLCCRALILAGTFTQAPPRRHAPAGFAQPLPNSCQLPSARSTMASPAADPCNECPPVPLPGSVVVLLQAAA